MFEVKTTMELLTGDFLPNALNEFLEQTFEDFPEVRANYTEAIARCEAGQELNHAIEAQTASDLLFSAALGLRANWEHFRDPVARTFLEVEPETYLRESVAHSLPRYIEARKLTDAAEADEAVTAYTTYLETLGPKLAHCFGYLLGDALLPQLIPGYQPDPLLTLRYQEWMRAYCGIAR